MNRFLLWLTRNRPMKQIDVEGMPYLQRYFMASIFGRQVWLHRFMSGDGKEELHGHPWRASTIVLSGGYVEEQLTITGTGSKEFTKEVYSAWGLDSRKIDTDTVHRIVSVEPGTWTALIVAPGRTVAWAFYDKYGFVTRWMPASPTDWHKSCGRRGK